MFWRNNSLEAATPVFCERKEYHGAIHPCGQTNVLIGLRSPICQKWFGWSGEKQPIDFSTPQQGEAEVKAAVSSFIIMRICFDRRGSNGSTILESETSTFFPEFARFASVLEGLENRNGCDQPNIVTPCIATVKQEVGFEQELLQKEKIRIYSCHQNWVSK